ncbi:MAG: C-terminal helicase domain-containing protein [Gemmataceae bacterium]|nr:C-terminal helicase domain-containing protein [Gemmataceae bacterium]
MPSVLVFTRTKQAARRLARTIAADGFAVTELHSNLTQPQRNRAMQGFRRGDFQVLVATNIAARGLDVTHITHVISFDVPNVPDDYVHRIGRTARAEAEGDAFVLVSPAEEKSLVQIERQIGQRLPRVTLPDFDYSLATAERAGKSGHRALKSPRTGPQPPHSRAASSSAGTERTGGNGARPRAPRSRRRRRR